MSTPIAAKDLRAGLSAMREGGWLSRPCPLSSFRSAAAGEARSRLAGAAGASTPRPRRPGAS